MKHFKNIAILFLLGALISNTFAGDKEDVLALVSKNIDAFNKQDYKTYFSNILFAD
jgi:hypothetical protein